jgi:para-nitrobenzyl esterase
VRSWKGIPFAAPPVGPLRFQPPQPAVAWTEVRDAGAFGPPCIASPLPGGSAEGPLNGSEDCLSLNVWSPVGAEEGSKPVLFWVHGGGFVRGGGSAHDGAGLCARGDVVVVTFNYRLGPWGFLHLAELAPDAFPQTSNLALGDIVAALRWAAENIAAFGGDPNQVTLVGESAGAMMIGALLACPSAHGLYARAALMSGAGYNIRDTSQATEIAAAFLKALGISVAEPQRLSAASSEQLRAAAAEVARLSITEPWDAEAFLPVVDGDLVPAHPMTAVRARATVGLPLLISTCRDEMRLFFASQPGLIEGKRTFGAAVVGKAGWGEIAEAYRRNALPGRPWESEMLGAAMFSVPAAWLASAHAEAGGAAWTLRIDQPLSFPPFSNIGACHVQDVFMLWESFSFGGPTLWENGSAADRKAAGALQDIVLAFVRNGDPRTADTPAWPRFTPSAATTLLLDASLSLAQTPSPAELDLWRERAFYGERHAF